MMEQLTRLTQAFGRMGVQQPPQQQRVPQAPRRAIHEDESEGDETRDKDSVVEQPWQRR